jgi:hypothetical protein
MAEIRWLTYDHFAQRRGQRFEVAVAEGPALDLELIEATQGGLPGGRGPDGQERMQFSVIFRGTAEPVLPQGTYQLTHAQLGELELFIVPIGADAEGVRYEAAFA